MSSEPSSIGREPVKVFVSYKHDAQPDDTLAHLLYDELSAAGYRVFIDKSMRIGTEWGHEIERQIKNADYALLLLSTASGASSYVATEIKLVEEAVERADRPRPLPIRITDSSLPYPIRAFTDRRQSFHWNGPSDSIRLVAAVRYAIENPSVDQLPWRVLPKSACASEIETIVVNWCDLPQDERADTEPYFLVCYLERCYSLLLSEIRRELGDRERLSTLRGDVFRVSDFLKRSGAEAPLGNLFVELIQAIDSAIAAAAAREENLIALSDELRKHESRIDEKRRADKDRTPTGLPALASAFENLHKNVTGIGRISAKNAAQIEALVADAMAAYRTHYSVATNGVRIVAQRWNWRESECGFGLSERENQTCGIFQRDRSASSRDCARRSS